MRDQLLHQLLAGGAVSIATFALHAVMTGLIIVLTHRVAGRTDELHVFMRVSALLLVAVMVMMVAHVLEISVWAMFYTWAGIETEKAGPFEFAFENYTALGYGDAVPAVGYRLIGPITALNGLLLIGWSVAIIFEVMKMADVQVGHRKKSAR